MTRLFRPSRGKLLLIAFWAAGVGVVCWLVPTGPRDGWQPASDDYVCGLLQDGTTLVVAKSIRRQADALRPLYGGPVLLRDIETGAVRASYFSAADRFNLICADRSADFLLVDFGHSDTGYPIHVELCDVLTGRKLSEFNHLGPYCTTGWEFSRDGRLAAAFGTDEDERYRTVICDRATGRRVFELPDCEAGRFSPDGRRFAATKRLGGIVFLEVPSGRQMTVVPDSKAPRSLYFFRHFSGDGKRAIDDHGQVWDVDQGTLVFKAPAPYAVLENDGRSVVSVRASPTEIWLAEYEIATGQERVERRIKLMSLPATAAQATLYQHGFADRLASAYGVTVYGQDLPLPRYLNWVRQFPTVQRWVQPRIGSFGVAIDAGTGEVLIRTTASIWAIAPDRRFGITHRAGHDFQIWDIPARRPLRWLIGSVEAWSLLFVAAILLVRRYCRVTPPAAAAPPA